MSVLGHSVHSRPAPRVPPNDPRWDPEETKAQGAEGPRPGHIALSCAPGPPGQTASISTQAPFRRQRGACLSRQDASGLQVPSPSCSRCVPPVEVGAYPGALGSPVLQPSTSPKCYGQTSLGGAPCPRPLPAAGGCTARRPPCTASSETAPSPLLQGRRGAGREPQL